MAKAKGKAAWPTAAVRECEAKELRIKELEAAAKRARELMVSVTGYIGASGPAMFGLQEEYDATFRDLTYALFPHLKPAT